MLSQDSKSSLITFFMPSLMGGGAEKAMVIIASGLAEKGHKVHFVLGQAVGPFLRLLHSSIRVVNLRTNKISLCFLALTRYLRRNKPTVIFSALGHANLVAIWAKLFSRIPLKIVICEHSTLKNLEEDAKSRWRGIFLHPLMRFFYHYADEIVAVSNGISKELRREFHLPEKSIRVIFNPVIDENFFSLAKEPIFHKWFPIQSVPVILGVGRLTKAKNFATLIRAFAIVKEKINAKLLILGEGEDRLSLESLIKSHNLENDVDLPGFKENPRPFLAQSSVFVLSSAWEGLPTVLIEALSLGIPIVSTDCPTGPSEILQKGKLGKLVPPGDQNALAKEILATLQAPPLQKFGENAIKRFQVETALESYQRLLKDCQSNFSSRSW